MKCGYSREILALYIEDDLPAPDARLIVRRHVDECAECEQYCRQLQASQSLIKSRLRSRAHDAVTAETLAGVRHAVMSQIGDAHRSLGWALQLERMLLLGFRRQRFAMAGFAIVAIVSASLVFVGKDKVVRPDREWVFVGAETYHNVYINPEAYREYSKSGKLPDGTLVVRTLVSANMKKELPKTAGCFSCHTM